MPTPPSLERCWVDLRHEVEGLIENRSPHTQHRVRALLGTCELSRRAAVPARGSVHADPRAPPVTNAPTASSGDEHLGASRESSASRQKASPASLMVDALSIRAQQRLEHIPRFVAGGPLLSLPDAPLSLACLPRRDCNSGAVTFAAGGYDGVLRIAERPSVYDSSRCRVVGVHGASGGAILSVVAMSFAGERRIALGTATGVVELLSVHFSDVDSGAMLDPLLNADAERDASALGGSNERFREDALVGSAVVVPWSSTNRRAGNRLTTCPSDIAGARRPDDDTTGHSNDDFALESDAAVSDLDVEGSEGADEAMQLDAEQRMVDSMILSGTDSRDSACESSSAASDGPTAAVLPLVHGDTRDRRWPSLLRPMDSDTADPLQVRTMAKCLLSSKQQQQDAKWHCAAMVLAFHGAGTVLAGTRDGRVCVVDVANGGRVITEVPMVGTSRAPPASPAAVSQLISLSNSNCFLAGNAHGQLCLYDTRSAPRAVSQLCGGAPPLRGPPIAEGWQKRLSTARAALNELRGSSANSASAIRSLHRWRCGGGGDDEDVQILAASDDGTLRLFDLRHCSSRGPGGSNPPAAVWALRASRKPLLAAVPLTSGGVDGDRCVALTFEEDAVKIVRVMPHGECRRGKTPPLPNRGGGNSSNVSFTSDGGAGHGSTNSADGMRCGSEHLVSVKGMHKSRQITCSAIMGVAPTRHAPASSVVVRGCAGGTVSAAAFSVPCE